MPRPTASADAKAQADRMVDEAKSHGKSIVDESAEEAHRIRSSAAREYDSVTGRARTEAQRTIDAANNSYDKSVADGIAEQQRLVSEAEVVAAAKSEAGADHRRGSWRGRPPAWRPRRVCR